MLTEGNKAIVRRFLEQAYNQGNLATADELIATDFVDRTIPPGQAPSLEGAKQGVLRDRTGFPDLQITVEEQIAEGDTVATRYTARGAHRGEWMGIPATGKQVTITGIAINRITGGKIIELWHQQDALGLLQQLGAMSAPGQAER